MKYAIAALAIALAPGLARAQGTLADYQRAQKLQTETRGLVVNMPGTANWIGDSHNFWYTRSVKGGTEFMMVDASTSNKKPAFDHDRLATAINTASGGHYTGLTLPFAPALGGRGGGGGGRGAVGPVPGALTFSDNQQTLEFGAAGFMYKCTLANYQCTKGGAIPAPAANAGRRGNAPEPEIEDDDPAVPYVPEVNSADGVELVPPQQDFTGGPGGRGQGQQPCGTRPVAGARGGRGQGGGGRGGRGAAAPATEEQQVCASFDGKWEALIENHNVFLRAAGSTGHGTPLSFDGSEGNYYSLRTVAWSPDSKKLVAYHTRPGYDRQVHYIESSPADQVQPKHWTTGTRSGAAIQRQYQKPGDARDIAFPALFDIATKKETEIDPALFPNAYDLTAPVWWKDGRGFTFDYNQRGHQVYRVIEVDAQTGKARALITETSPTFIDYQNLPSGKRYRYALNDGKEIIWGSERDGWEHLYLYDGVTGQVKRQITKGNWVVRGVDRVDEERQQIWFSASGMNADQDPYFIHHYRINLDGTGLIKLTEANGNHTVTFSRDRQYYVDAWSRVDQPPVAQLRRTEDRKVILDLENADASALLAKGFTMPEVFVAKARDGKTDIWGTIVRPANFDASKKYPVIEQIYAGPQGSFVPKTFSALPGTQALAELGFIVVQIDGMGTNNRGKAFHNVAWKNLGDAGFPDRILWHKAAAAKYSWYDVSRVGIYGTSAGGQNAMGAMLFHPDFYKVAVTNSGCHDNRMDKIWWNELWMGWPIGPEYGASSNVDNAAKLQGKVLIIIPELDTNVDPSSSMQVVNALIKANKRFDMLVVPGADHGAGGVPTGQRYQQDYFVHNLLGVEPPDWNRVSLPPVEPATGGN